MFSYDVLLTYYYLIIMTHFTLLHEKYDMTDMSVCRHYHVLDYTDISIRYGIKVVFSKLLFSFVQSPVMK